MKNLSVYIIIILFAPIVAFARPADPSRFPKYEPLQQTDPNVLPNESGNINFSDQEQLPQASGTGQDVGQSSEQRQAGENKDNQITQNNRDAAETGSGSKSGAWMGVVLAALFIVGLGYVWYKKRAVSR